MCNSNKCTENETNDRQERCTPINDILVEKVTSFKYLNFLNNVQLDDEEVRTRQGIVCQTFRKWQQVFLPSGFAVKSRKMLCIACIAVCNRDRSLKVKSINRLEVFEIQSLRRLLRIPSVDKVTKEEVLRRSGVDRKIFQMIKRRKIAYFGHLFRGEKYESLRLLISGKIDGKKPRVQKKLSWLRNIRHWNLDTRQLFRIAERAISQCDVADTRQCRAYHKRYIDYQLTLA